MLECHVIAGKMAFVDIGCNEGGLVVHTVKLI